MASRTKKKERPDRFNLSPKQATALRLLARGPLPIEKAQHMLQTTLGALYRRGYASVQGDHFDITESGQQALREQTHASIERSHSMYGHGFARIIRELSNYHPENTQNTKVFRMPRSAA